MGLWGAVIRHVLLQTWALPTFFLWVVLCQPRPLLLRTLYLGFRRFFQG